MRITEGVILKVEHDLIADLMLAGCSKEGLEDSAMYIAGVNDMAQAVIEAMRDGAKTVSNPRLGCK